MGAWVLGILVSSLSMALGAPETVRFTQWEDLASPSATQIQLRSAVKLIETDNGQCTATVISSRGDMITARHCLTKCLILSHIVQLKTLQAGAVEYFDVDPSQLSNATCDIKVDRQPVSVQVTATSPGFIFAFDENAFKVLEPQKYAELVALGYTNQGDFAIIRAQDAAAGQPCVPLSERPAVAGDVQQTLGYPGETARPDGFNSDGVNMFYSKGYVIPTILDNACVKELTLNDYQKNNMLEEFDAPYGFLSTLDATYGSSGTSVLGPDNGVAGILTNTFRKAEYTNLASDEPDNIYCQGSARALNMATILRSVRAQNIDTSVLKCN